VNNYLQAAVSDYMKQRGEQLDRLCEAALATGRYGVLVINKELGHVAQVNPNVPYGEIQEWPDCPLAWEKWVGDKP